MRRGPMGIDVDLLEQERLIPEPGWTDAEWAMLCGVRSLRVRTLRRDAERYERGWRRWNTRSRLGWRPPMGRK